MPAGPVGPLGPLGPLGPFFFFFGGGAGRVLVPKWTIFGSLRYAEDHVLS